MIPPIMVSLLLPVVLVILPPSFLANEKRKKNLHKKEKNIKEITELLSFTTLEMCVKDRATGSGRWTEEEHTAFIVAFKIFGKKWKRIAEKVGTRTASQSRSHAQRYIQKLLLAHDYGEIDTADLSAAEFAALSDASRNRNTRKWIESKQKRINNLPTAEVNVIISTCKTAKRKPGEIDAAVETFGSTSEAYNCQVKNSSNIGIIGRPFVIDATRSNDIIDVRILDDLQNVRNEMAYQNVLGYQLTPRCDVPEMDCVLYEMTPIRNGH